MKFNNLCLLILLSAQSLSVKASEGTSWTSEWALREKMHNYVTKFIQDKKIDTNFRYGHNPEEEPDYELHPTDYERKFRRYNALHFAIINEDKPFLEYAIPALNRLKLLHIINANGAGGYNPGGGTPLHLAAKEDDLNDIVILLLNNGADPNIENANSFTPLKEALIRYQFKNAKVLIEKTDCKIIKEIYERTQDRNIKNFIQENNPCGSDFLEKNK